MANITLNLEVTSAWQDVSTDLSLANGTTYLMDLAIQGPLNMGNDSVVLWAKTDNTTAPTDALVAHPWRTSANGLSAQARFTQNANEHMWVKLASGSATLVATKA